MAKKNLHPKLYLTKIICDGQIILEILSPKEEIFVDIWSGNHPFYTGSKKELDLTGRIEKFKNKYKNKF